MEMLYLTWRILKKSESQRSMIKIFSGEETCKICMAFEISCRLVKVYGRTDGWTDRQQTNGWTELITILPANLGYNK